MNDKKAVKGIIEGEAEKTETSVIKHIKRGEIDEAVKASKELSPFKLTEIIGDFPIRKIENFLNKMKGERASKVLNEFPEEFAGDLVMEMDEDTVNSLVKQMTPSDVVDFFPHISDERKETVLSVMSPDKRKKAEKLAHYSEEMVGAHMVGDYISVPELTTVSEAITLVKESPAQMRNTDYIYVVDEDGKLLGMTTFKKLMFTNKEQPVKDVMEKNIYSTELEDPAYEVAQRIKSRRFKMIPVVNEHKVLKGVMTLNTAADLLSTEIAEEFVSLAGTIGDESFFTRPQRAIKMRLPWMVANVFLNLGAVTIISSYEATIEAVAILAAFLPMITDMGGNVGIQALSVSIRSLALGEAQFRDVLISMKKEIAIGLVNGLALGALFGTLAYLFEWNTVLAVVAGIALGVNVLVAGIIGGTMPFIIKRLGKDPAMMTGPVLTTITDMTGILIYLGLSTAFLVHLV